MSQEPGPKSSVPLVTAAYLAQASETEQPATSESASAGRGMTALQIANSIFGGLLAVGLIAGAVHLVTAVAKERDRRKCGVDWMLWIAGSDDTFEDKLNASLEDSRRKFEQELKDSIKPLEFQEFDINATFGRSPAFGGQ